mmetsp:Transcript_731/g.1695  ORF Transcript_731/g.1695 Transcript_731/m.1695 type:complete len:213 (-) Transcript_731:19-657(-)
MALSVTTTLLGSLTLLTFATTVAAVPAVVATELTLTKALKTLLLAKINKLERLAITITTIETIFIVVVERRKRSLELLLLCRLGARATTLVALMRSLLMVALVAVPISNAAQSLRLVERRECGRTLQRGGARTPAAVRVVVDAWHDEHANGGGRRRGSTTAATTARHLEREKKHTHTRETNEGNKWENLYFFVKCFALAEKYLKEGFVCART